MNRFMRLLLLSILSLTFAVGCGHRSNKDETEDVLLTSFRLIDEQRTDEAIQLLESESRLEPQNYKYKSALASAYAHKSGIKIQKLIPVFKKIEDLGKLKNIQSKYEDDATTSSRVNSDVLSASALLSQFSLVFDTFASIPVISADESVYIRHSIQILNDLKTTITPEDLLYRAVLNVVLFKHVLSENFIGAVTQSSTEAQGCSFALGAVNNSILELGRILIDTLSDIGSAVPKSTENMNALRDSVANAVSNLTLITTSLTVIDETSNMLIKESVIKNGFGKIFKCGGA